MRFHISKACFLEIWITKTVKYPGLSRGIIRSFSGQCDVVEFHQDKNGITVFGYDGKWSIVPVEYKHGKPKEHNADELQICAQAICLEEMFQTNINEGFLYYGENRRRSKVIFDADLRNEVKKVSNEMHDLFHKGYTPKVKPSKQCKACSLENLCMPKLQKTIKVSTYIEQNIHSSI